MPEWFIYSFLILLVILHGLILITFYKIMVRMYDQSVVIFNLSEALRKLHLRILKLEQGENDSEQ